MSKITAVSMAAPVLCLGMFTAATVSARRTGVSEYHQKMADMMKGMTLQTSSMTVPMSRGGLTPE